MAFFVAGGGVSMGAFEPPFEIPVSPDAVSLDVPNIVFDLDAIVEFGLENAKASLSEEVQSAIASNDLHSLSRMLHSTSVTDQIHAAIALGRLTDHGLEAQELLANFIASMSGLPGTQFGGSNPRPIAVAAAEEALESLGSPPESSSLPQQPQRHSSSDPMPGPHTHDLTKSPKDESASFAESPFSPQWPVMAVVVVAALGLLWLLLKSRK